MVDGFRTFDGLDCGCLIPLALAVQQIVLMLLKRTFGGSPKASTALEMTMTAQLPANLARNSSREDRRTHPISDAKRLLRYALAALGSTCHDTKNFEVARYTRFRGDVGEELDHQFSWRFGVPVR